MKNVIDRANEIANRIRELEAEKKRFVEAYEFMLKRAEKYPEAFTMPEMQPKYLRECIEYQSGIYDREIQRQKSELEKLRPKIIRYRQMNE